MIPGNRRLRFEITNMYFACISHLVHCPYDGWSVTVYATDGTVMATQKRTKVVVVHSRSQCMQDDGNDITVLLFVRSAVASA